jgi:pimeloyl-ACP methyl ester carboxylesterase
MSRSHAIARSFFPLLVAVVILSACGGTPTATPVPPTATPVPPTATSIPPTVTPVPLTATPVPPTATPIPPTATPVPTAAPTATPVPQAAAPTGACSSPAAGGIDWHACDKQKATLSSANLSNANLKYINLAGASLGGANLSNANLTAADLSNADLSGANLSGANLSGADLGGANLSGADLKNASLSSIVWTTASRSDAKTVWPTGYTPPVPAVPKDPTTLVSVGSYRLAVSCKGAGSPTVIFENGMGYTQGEWAAAKAALASQVRVCTYDRAGSGESDLATKSPRTSSDMVDDLHTLLAKMDLKPPYVLVGHAMLGGENVRLYAGRYPADVAGLVLVDTPNPDELLNCRPYLPPGVFGEPQAVVMFRQLCVAARSSNFSFEGGVDYATTIKQAQAVSTLGALPLVVLSRNPNSREEGDNVFDYRPGLPEDLWLKEVQAHSAGQADLLKLSTKATQIVAAKAGHQIPQKEPEAVVNAVQAILKQVSGK